MMIFRANAIRSGLNVLLVAAAVLSHGDRLLAQAPLVADAAKEEAQSQALQVHVEFLQKDLASLRAQLAEAQKAEQQDETLKKQVELLQKQIEAQQKMTELLLEHVRKQPIAGSPVEKLQTQVATLEARSLQAAQRNLDLAQSVDNLSEHLDAVERNGPLLPATLKELFFPSQTNESPISIYTNLTGRLESSLPAWLGSMLPCGHEHHRTEALPE
jgi:hypothetical protein